MDWLFALLGGYLLGSIPFGLLLAMAAGKGDIRQIGSGNIGATNVLRTGSKGLAAATLLLDAGKGFARGAGWPGAACPRRAALAALGAVLGHCFPVWLRFKGGKGVATTLGRVPRPRLADRAGLRGGLAGDAGGRRGFPRSAG